MLLFSYPAILAAKVLYLLAYLIYTRSVISQQTAKFVFRNQNILTFIVMCD